MRNGGHTQPVAADRSRAGHHNGSLEKNRLQIGELARRTQVSVETIRFYEARGLITASTRRASGYREFSQEVVSQVRFIGRAQALGFSLTEINELASLRQRSWSGDATAQLRTAVTSKLGGIEARLRELRALRKELTQMVAACDAACPVNETSSKPSVVGSECPLVEALEHDANSQSASPNSKSRIVVGPSKPGQRAGRQRHVPDRRVSIPRRKTR